MLVHDLVINKILQTKDMSIITTNNFGKEFFMGREAEYLFLMHHYKTYGVVPDRAVFINSFPDFELTDVGEPDSYLVAQLYDSYNTNYLASSFNSVRELIMAGKTDAALQQFKNSYEGLKQGVAMTCTDLLKDTADRYNAYVERTQDFSKFYVSTGFSELDKIIGGWDRKEEYGLIVARTNTGKSFVGIKMALAAAKQGLNVGFYSGEMSSRKVGYRLDTLAGHISNGALIHGNNCVKNEYEHFLQTLPLHSGSFKVITPLDISGPATIDAIKAFILHENIDIMFIDQISLLEDQRHGKTPVEKTSNISKDIKNLQVMLQIPIIAICQQNRTKNEDGSQDTTQIAQSDRLGQDCTVAIFLDKDKDDIMKLSLIKSRDSQNGVEINYKVDFNRRTWTYIPTETDETVDETSLQDIEDYYDPSVPYEDVYNCGE